MDIPEEYAKEESAIEEYAKEEYAKKKNGVNRIFFFRQFFSCSNVVLNFFISGLYMGATTVIVPQLRKEANSTDVVTPEMASWLCKSELYCHHHHDHDQHIAGSQNEKGFGHRWHNIIPPVYIDALST
ncbi:uncharacterized protein LOC123867696 [Maniola jurtina]|uniref:uncharacterized protein LOC123867696 n=1 Tax=Maniola jurtina TaxID=191418 RepID=UPI001E68DB1C|nr:uncharacterized protein LOC123867696 [Maniola jurtina]